ncbi:arginine--tRNA ligase [Isoptericola sp. b441]|uniref:Arginine--tRNA ligase n=1 Tax=Actinotalea lenta TaxID=3064654 RepID=A0ABT9DBN4_9CELL|nr:arginine--tRNA ligase [Isoptericola sp. b441]MDO8108288.1 arginine--tRNA ligase [Isoptericola sp. b441]
MTPAELSAALRDVLLTARADGALPIDADQVPASVTVERPRQREHGDWASNVALQLAKKAGMAPRALADLLAARLTQVPGVASVDVAGPGFLNITLDTAAAGELARTILEAGADYGRSDALAGQSVDLEFISANPTGPLHLGHTRWAAVGDALGRVLAAAGARVTREFYVNDLGVQMDRFGASIMAAAHGEPIPEDGYHGDYVADLATSIVAEQPDLLDLPREEQVAAFREAGYAHQLAAQKDVLGRFGTHFDVWYSERTLHTSGAVDRGFERLREQGHVFEADGAVWLRTTDFGDDKDRVLVKSDGSLTYFASDTAYYVDKRSRGHDVCIYLLGADHHGYVGRLKAVAACAGDDPEHNIEVLIGQLVNLLQGGEPVRMSKRAGTIITLADLIEWVGVDAARYSLTRASTDSPLTLDIDVITRKTNDNPVFYVQYAHARTANVSRNAESLGVRRADAFDPGLLDDASEAVLLGMLGEFPRVVAQAAELREPHRVARYLEELASAYHKWYDRCRVTPVGEEPVTDTHRTRLWLNDATRQVLANGLDLLGVSAPERM